MRHPISKKKIAKPRRKFTKAQSDAALIRALNFASQPALLLDIYEAVTSIADFDARIDQIAAELDPTADRDADVLTVSRFQFASKLTPELHQEFERLSDLEGNLLFWRSLGAFYLGCAVAAQLRNAVAR